MSAMVVNVRTLVDADTDEWLRMCQALWPSCPPERQLLEMEQFRASPGIVAVAETPDGELVGFAEVSIRRDHVEGTTSAPVPYLEGWHVDAAWRGHGVGRALIAYVEKWAVAQGYRELGSDAESENTGGIAAHVAVGFCEVGRGVHFVKRLAPST